MVDAPSGDRSQKRDYITRESEEEEEDQRERKNILHRLSVCHIFIMLWGPKEDGGGTKLVITQLKAGIIEKFIASSPKPYLLC